MLSDKNFVALRTTPMHAELPIHLIHLDLIILIILREQYKLVYSTSKLKELLYICLQMKLE
jgi:hypothetical protein